MITVIIGTNRPDSNSSKIALGLVSIYKAIGEDVQTLDLADLPPELFLPSAYGEKPPAFKTFSDQVLSASGLHLVVPEYNGGFPGVLKYFIDMLPFPESFQDRPVAFTGVAAGMFGALRPIEQLQQIFGYRNAHIFPNRVFIMGVHNTIDDAGEISDEKLKLRIDSQAKGFVEFISKLKPEAL
ncbi:MAG: NAD(P)H-dependent oxidoreductase [Verrucomicrobiota bacterium]